MAGFRTCGDFILNCCGFNMVNLPREVRRIKQRKPLGGRRDQLCGAVTSLVEVFNQASEVVMSLKVVNTIARRPKDGTGVLAR